MRSPPLCVFSCFLVLLLVGMVGELSGYSFLHGVVRTYSKRMLVKQQTLLLRGVFFLSKVLPSFILIDTGLIQSYTNFVLDQRQLIWIRVSRFLLRNFSLFFLMLDDIILVDCYHSMKWTHCCFYWYLRLLITNLAYTLPI